MIIKNLYRFIEDTVFKRKIKDLDPLEILRKCFEMLMTEVYNNSKE